MSIYRTRHSSEWLSASESSRGAAPSSEEEVRLTVSRMHGVADHEVESDELTLWLSHDAASELREALGSLLG